MQFLNQAWLFFYYSMAAVIATTLVVSAVCIIIVVGDALYHFFRGFLEGIGFLKPQKSLEGVAMGYSKAKHTHKGPRSELKKELAEAGVLTAEPRTDEDWTDCPACRGDEGWYHVEIFGGPFDGSVRPTNIGLLRGRECKVLCFTNPAPPKLNYLYKIADDGESATFWKTVPAEWLTEVQEKTPGSIIRDISLEE